MIKITPNMSSAACAASGLNRQPGGHCPFRTSQPNGTTSPSIRLSHRKHAINTCCARTTAVCPSTNARVVPSVADASQPSHLSQLNRFASGVFNSRRGRGANWTAFLVLCLCAGSALARPNISAAVPIGVGKNTLEVNSPPTPVPFGSVRSVDPPRSAHDLPLDVAHPALGRPDAGLVPSEHTAAHETVGAGKGVDLPGAVHETHNYPIVQIEFDRVKTPLIIGIWILSASIAKIGFHRSPKLNRIFPESCLLIVIGVIIGVILLFGTLIEVSPLTPNTFFLYMLPPIILDAGYFMPNRMFFDNLGTILLMAVVGTIFNIATIGSSLWLCGKMGLFGVATPVLDIFLFASLISAVDPVAVLAVFEEIHVNEILYIVVFGESLLNDAVTVVLYHMCEVYSQIGIQNINVTHLMSGGANFLVVALGGTIIGVIWGFLTGLVTRYTDNVRVIEPIFIFVMAYLAYLNAELFHMSGILAITFCGITMKNYVEANISQKSHTTIKYALKMVSSSSETIIFMFLGVATVNNRHDWNTWFILLTIFFCSIFRAAGVAILTALANRFRLHKLSNVDQFVMSYGGLRGAVAFALVLLIDKDHVPLQPMFVTTTIAVIYFTVFVQGITIKPLVKFLNVKRASKRKPTMNERIHERFIDHLMAGVEDIVGKTGNYNVRDKFKRFDNKFIRPLLIRDLQVRGAEPKILETYSKLTMKDAMDYMRRNPSTLGTMSGTESMSALFRNYTGVVGVGGSPSFSNFENCSRNLDMQELDYNPSKKDLTDAKIHHLLAEELKPYKRHRRLSYSRHAVDDRDLTTQQVNYKMHMNIRRMNDRKHHKRSKRASSKENANKQHVSFPELQQQNGSAKQLSNGMDEMHHSYRNIIRKHSHSLNKYRRLELEYINEVLHENSTMDDSRASKMTTAGGAAGGSNPPDDWEEGLTFTAKPTFGVRSEPIYASDENEFNNRVSRDSEGETTRVTTPTAIESSLPWKRVDEDDVDGGAIKQNEFPAWASNKEYIAYNSPSATFLGGLSKPRPVKSVIGLFRRESFGSQSQSGSDPTLAGHLNVEMQTVATRTPIAGRAALGVVERRSLCGPSVVVPISEISELNDDAAEHDDDEDVDDEEDDDEDDDDDEDEEAGACGGRRRRRNDAADDVAAAKDDRDDRDPLGALSRAISERMGGGVVGAAKASSSVSPSIGGVIRGHYASPYAVTASHRRNVRRGSMLELNGLAIPEEIYSKSLPEREKRQRAASLLPNLTPRSQLRRPNQRNQQTTSPLLSDSTDSETEEFHDGTDDPGRLGEQEDARKQEQEQQQQKSAASSSSTSRPRRPDTDANDDDGGASGGGANMVNI